MADPPKPDGPSDPSGGEFGHDAERVAAVDREAGESDPGSTEQGGADGLREVVLELLERHLG